MAIDLETAARTAAAASLLACAAATSASAEWTRTYAIEWNEPAMYYGAETGVIEPGTDCPAGTNPEIDYIAVLTRAGYTEEEANWLRDQTHPYRLPNHGSNQMAFRGEGRANVYMEPESTPDPGLTPVTGELAEGINLDGDESTGFTGLDGEPGIDNEFYRALGCWKTYRGPEHLSSGAMTFNDSMQNGGWTVVIVVAGQGDDPMNDENVRVGFYMSDDALVKDALGQIAQEYTFAVTPHAQFEAIFDARTVDGTIVSTAPTEEIWLRDPSYSRDLQLLQAQISLAMNEDGTLRGYLGGYRPWEPVYWGWVGARGTVIESLTWVELPSVWYSLKRHADYSPEGADGERTHISFAMRVEAVPAFVMTPDGTQELAEVVSFKDQAEPVRPGRPGLVQYGYPQGIVPDRDGVILAGPNAPIVPPGTSREELKAQRASGAGD